MVDRGLERRLLDAVDGFPGLLIVTSTFADVVGEIGRLARHVDTGIVVEAPFDGDPLAVADTCAATATLLEDELVTTALIDRARDSTRPLWVWTVNDAARITTLLDEPAVAGVITDDPALACALRAGRPVS